MDNLLVHKYGGSSLATPEQILKIAQRLGQLHDQGHKLIVVVSAMGKGTDKLIDLAHKVAKTPARREMDMLISTGERVSMSLMSMALQSLGYLAISFTGSQSGILTDQVHNKARITNIKPIRVEQALSENKIVIIAGFQGVDPNTKEITTLGRGGSDTTAVTLAAHFNATVCKTLKDVKGVHSSDPKGNNNSKLYETISFSQLKNMCFWGSPILHYRSVALSEKLSVPLFIGSSENDEHGTTVLKNEDINMFEQPKVIAISQIERIMHLQTASENSAQGYKKIANFLNEQSLAMPQILASAFNDGHLRLMFTDSKDALNVIHHEVSNSSEIKILKDHNSSITLTYSGAVDCNDIVKVNQTLSEQCIAVEKVISSPCSLSFVISNKDLEKANKHLQETFKC